MQRTTRSGSAGHRSARSSDGAQDSAANDVGMVPHGTPQRTARMMVRRSDTANCPVTTVGQGSAQPQMVRMARGSERWRCGSAGLCGSERQVARFCRPVRSERQVAWFCKPMRLRTAGGAVLQVCPAANGGVCGSASLYGSERRVARFCKPKGSERRSKKSFVGVTTLGEWLNELTMARLITSVKMR